MCQNVSDLVLILSWTVLVVDVSNVSNFCRGLSLYCRGPERFKTCHNFVVDCSCSWIAHLAEQHYAV